MPQIKFQGEQYELSTKLRVAFLVQKAHQNKPYTDVFSQVGTMAIEKQIEILWLAFREANSEYILANNITAAKFMDNLLDESNLTYILEALTEVIEGIMFYGMSEEEVEEKKRQSLEEERRGQMSSGSGIE